MFKTLISASVISLLSVFPVAANGLEQMQKEMINPVVQLDKQCSGVVIDTTSTEDTYIVTAEHCVPDPKQLSGYVNLEVRDGAKLVEKNELVYDVLVKDTKTDLAVIKLRKKGLDLERAVVGTETPLEGETTWTVGYPLGLTRTVTQGIFGGYGTLDGLTFEEFGNKEVYYRATPAMMGGNSGGGLFRKTDKGYELIGITSRGTSLVIGFYVPNTEINKIVERALKTETKTYTVEQKKLDD